MEIGPGSKEKRGAGRSGQKPGCDPVEQRGTGRLCSAGFGGLRRRNWRRREGGGDTQHSYEAILPKGAAGVGFFLRGVAVDGGASREVKERTLSRIKEVTTQQLSPSLIREKLGFLSDLNSRRKD